MSEVIEISKKQRKPYKSSDGPVYRNIAVRDIYDTTQDLLSQRRQLWIRVALIAMPCITMAPIAMPAWHTAIWAFGVPCLMLLMYAWDNVFFLRHFRVHRKDSDMIIHGDDMSERVYRIRRPDAVDVYVPYVMFLVMALCIMFFYSALERYQQEHGDSYLYDKIFSKTEVSDLTKREIKPPRPLVKRNI